MHALTCQNRLFGKFALFIIALFMFYYILYVSLLPPSPRSGSRIGLLTPSEGNT